MSKMKEIIEFIISNFECDSEYIYDEFHKYLTYTFAVKYPKKTKKLYHHYFPNESSVNIDDLYENIKDDVIQEILKRNENTEEYF